MEEYHRLLTDQVDLVNPEGYRLVPDVSKSLPLGGPLGQKKMLRENEVHKFSDGTLTRVLHKLDHMIKDFRLYRYNPGMENRIWSEDDKRSEEFMESGQFRNQRTVNVAAARENVGSKVVQQSWIQCFNCREFRHFAKECTKPKRVKDFMYHKEKMLLCKQAEQDTDEEVDKQELEAHYNYMAKIQEVPTTDSGIDSELVEQNEQNDVESNDERVALAN
nr:hypothetical protein [Tanacetum cinerariifolium]